MQIEKSPFLDLLDKKVRYYVRVWSGLGEILIMIFYFSAFPADIASLFSKCHCKTIVCLIIENSNYAV